MSTPESLDALAAHARDTRVAVIGGGVAGLVAALELAKVGVRVQVWEASDRPGGVVRTAEVAGIRLDVGAESFATRGGHVRRLIDGLGLGDAVTAPNPAGAWVAVLPKGAAAPLPAGGVLGIPANPWDPAVRRIIGWGGAWRSYLDRLRPPLTIGQERSLGRLVRTRLGEKVLDRLVAPVTTGVYSAHPDDIDVDIAAPGLNAALTRAGSLTGAVQVLAAERTEAPGGAVLGIEGGMGRLVDALVARLDDYEAELRVNAPVAALTRVEGGWMLTPDAPAKGDEPAPGDAEPARGGAEPTRVGAEPVRVGAEPSRVGAEPTHVGAEPTRVDAVVLAVPEREARRLLAPLLPSVPAAEGPAPVVEIVTLVLAASVLDSAPRGNGVLTVPGSHAAKALTHASAKWAWVARDAQAVAGPGAHVVRVSFGAQGEQPATEGMSDEDAAALAIEEASALLGVSLDRAQLVGAHRERYVQSQPGSAIGRAAAVAAWRSAIRAVPGLGAVGAWLSGTGLAQVVPGAIDEAERVRRGVLWGRSDSPADSDRPTR